MALAPLKYHVEQLIPQDIFGGPHVYTFACRSRIFLLAFDRTQKQNFNSPIRSLQNPRYRSYHIQPFSMGRQKKSFLKKCYIQFLFQPELEGPKI